MTSAGEATHHLDDKFGQSSAAISQPLSATILSTSATAATTTAVALPLTEVAIALPKNPSPQTIALIDAAYAAFAPFASISTDDAAVPTPDLGLLPPKATSYTFDHSTGLLHGGGRLQTSDLDLVLSSFGAYYLEPRRREHFLITLKRYATVPFSNFLALLVFHLAAPHANALDPSATTSNNGVPEASEQEEDPATLSADLASEAASNLVAPNPFEDEISGDARAGVAASVAAGKLAIADTSTAASSGAAAIDMEAMSAPLGVHALSALRAAFALFDASADGYILLSDVDLVFAALDRHLTIDELNGLTKAAHKASGNLLPGGTVDARLPFYELVRMLARSPGDHHHHTSSSSAEGVAAAAAAGGGDLSASVAASNALEARTILLAAPPLSPEATAEARAAFDAVRVKRADDMGAWGLYDAGLDKPLYKASDCIRAADVTIALDLIGESLSRNSSDLLPWLVFEATGSLGKEVPETAKKGEDNAPLSFVTFTKIVAALRHASRGESGKPKKQGQRKGTSLQMMATVRASKQQPTQRPRPQWRRTRRQCRLRRPSPRHRQSAPRIQARRVSYRRSVRSYRPSISSPTLQRAC